MTNGGWRQVTKALLSVGPASFYSTFIGNLCDILVALSQPVVCSDFRVLGWTSSDCSAAHTPFGLNFEVTSIRFFSYLGVGMSGCPSYSLGLFVVLVCTLSGMARAKCRPSVEHCDLQTRNQAGGEQGESSARFLLSCMLSANPALSLHLTRFAHHAVHVQQLFFPHHLSYQNHSYFTKPAATWS